jgi:hypothetical protein
MIDTNRLKPEPNSMITMRDLLHVGLINKIGDGVKLLAERRGSVLKTPIHLEVSQSSRKAIETIEATGGTVTCTHFNTLAVRALAFPYKFDILPRRSRPPPKLMPYYLDKTKSGYLSPEVQTRNLELFGSVTSESRYREEHLRYMEAKRRK